MMRAVKHLVAVNLDRSAPIFQHRSSGVRSGREAPESSISVSAPVCSRSPSQMADDSFPEPLNAFEALGAAWVVTRLRTRVSGANAQVVRTQSLSDLCEPLHPHFRRAEYQEAPFESRDGIAAEVRSHAATAVEVDLRHPPVAVPLSDLLPIVSDPT